MSPDEVIALWRGPGFSDSGAARSGKFAVPDSRTPGGGAAELQPDKWQAFVAEVQAMAPYS
jgi:Domain of unknown function (DUF397)